MDFNKLADLNLMAATIDALAHDRSRFLKVLQDCEKISVEVRIVFNRVGSDEKDVICIDENVSSANDFLLKKIEEITIKLNALKDEFAKL